MLWCSCRCARCLVCAVKLHRDVSETITASHAPCRVVGQATQLFTDGNATDASQFASALYQSFREQYQFFNLLNQFNSPVPAIAAPTTPATGAAS